MTRFYAGEKEDNIRGCKYIPLTISTAIRHQTDEHGSQTSQHIACRMQQQHNRQIIKGQDMITSGHQQSWIKQGAGVPAVGLKNLKFVGGEGGKANIKYITHSMGV
jgi:hypothetical protein